MKVLYLIPGLGGGGGAERSFVAMAPYLQQRVALHAVTFSERAELTGALRGSGVETTNLTGQSIPAVARGVRALIDEHEPDIVHTTLFVADVAGRLGALGRRTCVVTSLVNENYGPAQRAVPGMSAWRLGAAWALDAVTARRVQRFHALTAATADVMSKRLRIDRQRIDVIPRGRAPEELGRRTPERRMAARRSLGIDDSPLVVAAARHEWQKGLDVLLRAAPLVLDEVPEARFVVAGRDGQLTPVLRELASASAVGDRVQLIGYRADVPELLCAADAFCVPSRWEGLGSILVEAMALETPVVASGIAPIRELAGSPPWLDLVTPEDPVALAEGLVRRLRGAPGLADPTLARARFLAHHAAEAVAGEMVDLYERALGGGAAGRRYR